MESGLYQSYCARRGIEVIPLDPTVQQAVQTSIFHFKYHGLLPENRQSMADAAHRLVEQGAEALLLGCTEIPLILSGVDFPIRSSTPMQLSPGRQSPTPKASPAPSNGRL